MNVFKRILALLTLLSLLIPPLCACNEEGKGSGSEESDKKPDIVLMTVKDYGKIKIRLYPEKAPLTVSNFKGLVAKGYYDGLSFHRIIEGFMIQGGRGKNAPTIKGEFSENGIQNDIKHVRGTVSMARAEDMDSASSQFFICQSTYDYGDGKYAAFGEVIEGMMVVDLIAAAAVNPYNNAPLSPVIIESIVFVEE
ncbi:MAG: peptidylprolyl isomerase [Clostridia bacterium]|nr:peptidylprolyl isomerase [Clostridia bacterium]